MIDFFICYPAALIFFNFSCASPGEDTDEIGGRNRGRTLVLHQKIQQKMQHPIDIGGILRKIFSSIS